MTSLIAKIVLQLSSRAIFPSDINSFVSSINSNMKDLTAYTTRIQKGNSDQQEQTLDLTKVTTQLLKVKLLSRVNQGFRTNWINLVNSNSGVESSLLSVNRQDWNSKLTLMSKVLVDDDLNPKGEESNEQFKRKWFRNLLFGDEYLLPEYLNDDAKNGKNGKGKGGADDLVMFSTGSFSKVRDRVDAGDWEGAQKQIDLVCDMLDFLLGFWDN
ncbi:unnamed protein product [Ambrosiozyma monospora]|uniref:Unnamed protein product n=1 Tax=Ambrosiozyma monospora TaxID=43982 RepID=A0ACB5T6P4_AMBMO|nr:unnamed protein product [Ambrosiozyma monospora]